jgi:hypothetical protein
MNNLNQRCAAAAIERSGNKKERSDGSDIANDVPTEPRERFVVDSF